MIATQPPANDIRMDVEEKKWPSETVVTSEPPSAVSTQSQSPRCMYHKDCGAVGGGRRWAAGGGRWWAVGGGGSPGLRKPAWRQSG